MREENMRELMQQELAVPDKVHDAFEKGIEQAIHMDVEPVDTKQKAGQKGHSVFWRRAALVAAAAAAVFVISFHSQIYSFAKSLFIHDAITVGGEKNVQESDMKIVKIKDGVLRKEHKDYYFESMEDLGEQLGISFLKSSVENTVTGKGRTRAMIDDFGQVTLLDFMFFVHDVSQIKYTTDEGVQCFVSGPHAYTIDCQAQFYTKAFQDDFGINYEDSEVIEEYETAHGLHAILFQYENASGLHAVIYNDNIRYEYSGDGMVDADGKESICTLEDFKAFLDTLTK